MDWFHQIGQVSSQKWSKFESGHTLAFFVMIEASALLKSRTCPPHSTLLSWQGTLLTENWILPFILFWHEDPILSRGLTVLTIGCWRCLTCTSQWNLSMLDWTSHTTFYPSVGWRHWWRRGTSEDGMIPDSIPLLDYVEEGWHQQPSMPSVEKWASLDQTMTSQCIDWNIT